MVPGQRRGPRRCEAAVRANQTLMVRQRKQPLGHLRVFVFLTAIFSLYQLFCK